MHYELFHIGNIHIYSYGLMIAIGVIVCLLLAEKRCRRYGLDTNHVYSIAFTALFGGLIGAKLLFFLVEWKAIAANPALVFDVRNGFVVYGGIAGGIAAVWIYAKAKKLPFLQYFDLAMPSVALAQAFGRIGCFLAGCCYGKETDSPFGVVFHDTPMAPTGVRLIPTQLLSSAGDLLLCVLLCMYAKRSRKDGQVAGLYLICYSVGRFLIEFLRDDPRGAVGSLSTSQFISLLLFAAGAVYLVYIRKFVPDRTEGGEAEAKADAAAADGQQEA